MEYHGLAVTRLLAGAVLLAGSSTLAAPPAERPAAVARYAQALDAAGDVAAFGRDVLTPFQAVPLFNGPDSGSVRSWHTTLIDEDALFGGEALARQADGEPLTFDLRADGKPSAFRRVPMDLSIGEDESWYGEMVGDPGAYALFVRHNGVVSGKVSIPGKGLFEILPSGGGAHIVREVDAEALPPCGNTAAHQVAGPGGPDDDEADLTVLAPDRGSFIFVDVLLLYTTAARLGAGTTANMESQLTLSVADCNLAYTTSGITMRVRVPAMVETTYVEAPTLADDLGRLAFLGDNQVDEAHSLRSTYSADQVSLITAAATGGACGIGYLMTNVSPTFANSAFSVTARTCLSNLTLPHELGHNQGCAHDRNNSSGPGAFFYSFGYRDAGAAYRSIMAYAPGLRTKLFSNPNITFPNGQAAGLPLEHPQSAYNAMSLQLAAPTVAAWRTLFVSPPGSFNLLTPAAGVTTPSRNVTFTWSAAPETDYYRVIVDDNPNFTNPEISYEPVTTTSYSTPVNSLNLGVQYFWKVVAVNPLGSANSTPAIRSFTTPSIAPSAFTLNLPPNGGAGVSTKPLFQWLAADNADTYTLTVDDNADFSSPAIHVSGIVNANFSAQAMPLQPNVMYFWKVQATNTFGTTNSSPTSASFTTIGLPPEDFALVSPPDGPNVATTIPTLTWSPSNFADSYELIVDDALTFDSPVYQIADLTETSHQIPPATLESGVRYYWRVIASNTVGSKPSSPVTYSFGVLVPFCFGDADRSSVVNFNDITAVVSNWGGSGPIGDANNTGTVDFGDISTVLSNWGAECPQ